jgi:siderophore synthetase component
MITTETMDKSREIAGGGLVQALGSVHFFQVEQRIIRQLIQALIYEEIVACDSGSRSMTDGRQPFRLAGKTDGGEAVVYEAQGRRMASFGRVHLDRTPVKRMLAGGRTANAQLGLFVTEMLAQVQQGERLAHFMEELEQTLLKDVQAQAFEPAGEPSSEQRSYDELEGNIKDGHPYHPCYKSRIGFTLSDNAAYGPEFKRQLKPVWIAVSRHSSKIAHSEDINYSDFIRKELGGGQYASFNSIVTGKGRKAEDYSFMPVHPWQWKNVIIPQFYLALKELDIIVLGEGNDLYRPQQSIRTLANFTSKDRAYLKLSLSITTTSTSRIMAGHTVLNGPLITDWLHNLIQDDDYAKQLNFVILREVLGVTYDYGQLPEHGRHKAYGTLGAVWRESLHPYLYSDEDGVPFNGLCHVDSTGVPLIDPWIQAYGVEAWSEQVLRAAVSPIIHMLYAHGIGMESHGQNIILLHKQGVPLRVVLKDFHDGVRFSAVHLTEPGKCPILNPEPTSHALVNPNSFIKTDNPVDVRDFTYDAFFFICLSELAMFLEEHYQLEEHHFWKTTAKIIIEYQHRHPQHQERYRLFDLFEETVQIEELTKRRLFGDGELRFKSGRNPLYPFRPALC